MKRKIIEECLKKCIDFEDKEVDFDRDLQEYGMNSITVIKFLVLIETKLGIEFDESVFSLENYGTLNKILEYIENM